MPPRKKNIKKSVKASPKKVKRITLYNKILKEFTAINNSLPLERKLSLAERRKYIREKLIPKYKGKSPHRVAKNLINTDIIRLVNKIPPKVGCDVNLLSPAIYANIGFFELNDFIEEVLPKCIYIRIDAKQFGKTKIFNTLNYNYATSGVRDIVEKAREYIEENRSKGNNYDISLTGVKKLKIGKANDGTPENYFLDFILVVNDEPQDDTTPVDFKVPTKKIKTVKSIRRIINERVKQLSLKKKRKKNARKTAMRNLKKISNLSKRQKTVVKRTTKDNIQREKNSLSSKSVKQLDNQLKKGLITPEQHRRFLNLIITEITKKYGKGGKI